MARSTDNNPERESETASPATATHDRLRQRIAKLERALRKARQSMETLRESEAQFRNMAHNSLLGMAMIVDGRYTYANPAYKEIFGYSAEEMLSVDPLALVAPSDRAFAAEKLRQASESMIDRAEFSMRIQRKGGREREVEFSGSAVDINGKRLLILLARDITLRVTAERKLRESEETLRTVSASTHDAIIMIDNDGRISFWNDAARTIFGHTRDEAIGQDLHALLAAPQYRHDHKQAFAEFRNTGKGAVIGTLRELEAVKKDGTVFPVELSLSAVKLDGKWNAVGVVRDITERKAVDRQLRMFRTLINQSNDAIEVIDAETYRLLDVNERAGRDLGYSREELLSLSVSDIDGKNDPVWFKEIGENLQRDGFVVTESLHRRKDGSVFPVELSLRWVVLDKPYVVSVARDITKRKQDEEKLRQLQERLLEQSIHDPLTGLYNRRYLEEVLERELIVAERKGSSVCAIMGDLDHFKRVNDAYGHRAGDEVLRTFGQLMKSCSRGSDVDSRFGGEEFLLLLPGMTAKSACERAEQLRRKLASTPIHFEGADIHVTGSFGVACYPRHARSGDGLVSAADKALYAAKKAGRNRVEVFAGTEAVPAEENR